MKIFIVVDVQEDFVYGSLGSAAAEKIVPKIANKILSFRDKDTLILRTRDTHFKDYLNSLEGKNLPIVHCIKGEKGHEIVEEIKSAYALAYDNILHLNEIIPELSHLEVIDKITFGSIDLQEVLSTLALQETIEDITFVGLCTGICVLSNAILAKATLPEIPINVIADCCACVTPESHKTALEAMKLCQINII